MYTKSTKIVGQLKKNTIKYFDLPYVWRKPKQIQCSYYSCSASADAVLHTIEKVVYLNAGSKIL